MHADLHRGNKEGEAASVGVAEERGGCYRGAARHNRVVRWKSANKVGTPVFE